MNKGKARRITIKIARIAFVFYWLCLVTLWPLAPLVVKPVYAATHTYVVNDTDAQAYEGGAADGGFNDDDGEFTSGDYANIDGDDSNNVQHSESGNGLYQYHRFDFIISEEVGEISQIDVTWKGYGYRGADISFTQSLWMKENSSWAEKDASTVDSPTPDTLTVQYTSDFSKVISSGHMEVAAQADRNAVGPPINRASYLISYYAEVKITYTEGGGGGGAPEFTMTGMLLAVMGGIAGYFVLQRRWNHES